MARKLRADMPVHVGPDKANPHFRGTVVNPDHDPDGGVVLVADEKGQPRGVPKGWVTPVEEPETESEAESAESEDA